MTRLTPTRGTTRNTRNIRLSRAAATFEEAHSFLLDLVCDDLLDRLSMVERRFERAVALFGATHRLSGLLDASDRVSQVLRVEEEGLLPRETGGAMSDGPNGSVPQTFIATPDDPLPGLSNIDLVVAPVGLHFAADLPQALSQIRQAMVPDGLFLACLPGPDTLTELRHCLLVAESAHDQRVAMRVDPFTELQSAGRLLQTSGFALPVVDRMHLTVRYSTMLDLIRDLRSFGVTGTQFAPNTPRLTRRVATDAATHYETNFADADGRLRATFEFIFLSGWVPHESQQQPLRPGSAKMRLADALEGREIPLPE